MNLSVSPATRRKLRALCILLPAHLSAMVRPRPIWSHVWVTRRCNLTCDYCFVLDYEKEQHDTEGMKRIIDKLYDLGNRFVSFVGGEPTIRKDFLDLVRYAYRKRMVTHFSTNGVLLNDAYVHKIGQSGVDVVNLSIDSAVEFDSSRKDYARSGDALDRLLRTRDTYGFEVVTNLVLTSKNLETVVPTIEMMAALRVPISIGLISGNFYSKDRSVKTPIQHDDDLFFDTPEKRERLFSVVDALIALKRQGRGIINVEDYFHDIKRFLSGEKVDWYCSGGEYYLSVDCDGKVGICSLLNPEPIDIHDLETDTLARIHQIRDERLAVCHSQCLSLCFYQSSYYVKKPLYFVRQTLQSALKNTLRTDFDIVGSGV